MPRTGTIARRYAEAAFELALRDDNVDEWLFELTELGRATSDASLVRRLEDPQVPLETRRAALVGALGDRALPQMSNLVALLLRRRRVEALPSIAREFRRLYNKRAGIVEASATSALELQPAEVDAIRAHLEKMTSNNVELELLVDPALLGGVQLRVGDLLIDGSVRGRLERLRSRLESGTLTP